MAWEIDSRHLATIERNAVRNIGTTPAVSIMVQAENGERGEALIWLTPKSMGMARQALHVCGFDVDKRDLFELDANHLALEGNRIPIRIEEYKGKPQIRIDTDAAPPKSIMAALTKGLRDAKGSNDVADGPPIGDEPPPLTDDDSIPF